MPVSPQGAGCLTVGSQREASQSDFGLRLETSVCPISSRQCRPVLHSGSGPGHSPAIASAPLYFLATSQPCSSPPCSLPWSCLDSAPAHNQYTFKPTGVSVCFPQPPFPHYSGPLSQKLWSASTPLLRPLLPLILVAKASSGLALSSPSCSPWKWASLLSSWKPAPAQSGGC